MSDFETVHTVFDYYDGPRSGITDFRGKPHVYESIFDDTLDDYSDTFRLSPISDAVLRLALEDWAIWLRWETAFHRGETPRETHPALSSDRARHDELRQLLHGQLAIDPSNCFCATAEFRVRHDETWSGYGMRPLEAHWSPTRSVG